jgi:3-methylcrotonyl-CoA carboxylase alpha subunit
MACYDPVLDGLEKAETNHNLTAPMPGTVVAVLVQAGDTVEAGQPLMVLEAMKMEHSVVAAAKGTVAEILYAVGERVAEGVELLRLEDVA